MTLPFVYDSATNSHNSPETLTEEVFILPASFAQQRLWFLDQFEPGNSSYNLPAVVQLTGALDVTALEQSFNEMVRRHEILRTTFNKVDGQPVQIIHPTLTLDLPVADIRLLPERERQIEADRLVAEEIARPFSLENGPLLRVALLRQAEEEYLLILTIHHIVFDGWSMGVFIREVAALYEAFCSGKPSVLPPLSIQYADFAVWQQHWLQGKVLETQLSYWKQQLDGLSVLQLPTDRPRSPVSTFREAKQSLLLPLELAEALKTLSQGEGVSPFMLLLAAFKTLLHRYTGQDDIVVGTPIANRNRAEIESLIGFFVNTLVLRTNLDENPSFRDVLRRVREITLEAYARQDLPFEKLVEELQPDRDLSRQPLFQVMFVFQNAPMPALELPGVTLKTLLVDSGTTQCDMTLEMLQSDRGLMALVKYNSNLFDAGTITRMLGHFSTLLEGIVANPDSLISELPLLTETELHTLVNEWNTTKVEYPQDKCIHELFEAQVERSPDSVAVVFENKQLTYRELNQQANHLAHYLRSLGVGTDVLVGICVDRSLDTIVGILGILKAGGAYVPLDTAYPPERLAFILEDTQAPVLLTQKHLLDKLPDCKVAVVCLDADLQAIAFQNNENLVNTTVGDNLAYTIYTSGSTGKPKGVLMTHANVVRLFAATQSWFHFDETDVWTLFHSYAFDFSVWEIWGALIYGGRLVVVSYWVSRSPEAFYELLCAEQVTILNQTPSAFRQLIRAEESFSGSKNLNLRLVIFGGEALELQSLKPWFDRHGDERPQLVNMYGITETTVHVTYRPLTIADLSKTGSVIGNPIPDLQVYVLDRHLQPLPIGVPGEMYVGGAGLARGYLNRPDLAGDRFIPNPYSDEPGARLYKTGDLARYLANGDIEYLGRIDHQVKVRGFRIELGEIEAAIAQHPRVRETVVLVREDKPGDKQIVAYWVSKQQPAPTVSELRSFLKEKLPEYMVPSAFVMLETLPLTVNGKIDRRALPAPDTARPEFDAAFVAPSTPEEKVLADIWAEVLGIEQIGIHDNFFALGGDSIRSIQVRAIALEKGLNFSLQQLFQHQTIHQLSPELRKAQIFTTPSQKSQPFSLISQEDRLSLPDSVEDAYPLAMLQAGMIFHSEYNRDSAIYHDIFSYDLQAAFNIQALQAAIEQLINRHPVLRTSFQLTGLIEPLQLVHQTVDVPFYVEDLRHLSAAEQEKALGSWLEFEKKRQFDWTRPPLVRFQVHRRTEETFQLTLSFHHAILDGWSVASMLTELLQNYQWVLSQKVSHIQPNLAIAYRDFVALERESLASEECQNYWLQKLSDSTVTLLPRWSDRKASDGQPRLVEVPIAHEVSVGLKQLARFANVPLKSVLLAAHLRVLNLLSNQTDVLTGLVSNGRPEDTDGEKILGLFLNTLPYRLKLHKGTWIDLVRETFKGECELVPFRRYPLAQLLYKLGGQPLFETAFNFINFHVYQDVLGGEGIKFLGGKFYEETNLTLLANFGLDPSSSLVKLTLNCKDGELCDEQIEAIAGYYARTLAAMADQPFGRFENCSLLSARERQQLIGEWNNTLTALPEVCIHQLFEAQVERSPDAVAVVFENQQLTYRELNQKANQLAHYLQQLGVGTEVLVGICLERSIEMIIALLGILKAGGAYVPLDPAYPPERLAFMLSDAKVSVLVTQARLLESLPYRVRRAVCVDASGSSAIACQNPENIAIAVTPNNRAYVIYTSGSTGKPKGVQILHRAVVNFLSSMSVSLRITSRDVLLAVTTLSFDIAALEIYLPLIVGAKVAIASREVAADGKSLSQLLSDSGATVMQATPATWRLLLAAGWLGNKPLKILVGGEALSRELADKLRENCCSELWNLYGPTETTIWSTVCNLMESDNNSVSIGRPIANTQIYVFDEHLMPVPIGVPGELHIGGVGLSSGYLNRPELSAEKFIPNPYCTQISESRLYKTGDLVRYLSDGNIEFLGRIDNQVKIRGFRIEIGEIEAVLAQYPGVRQTVVVAREDSPSDRRLVAYLVVEDSNKVLTTNLRSFLKEKLPDYMVPSAFVMLEAMPLTPNGKVDRRALPAPDTTISESESVFVAPRTPVEEVLTNIWAEVLSRDRVSIEDNFFDLGGHSLLATQLFSRIRDTFRVELPLRCLFEAPTVAELSDRIQATHHNPIAPPLVPVSRSEELPLSFAQQRLWFLDRLDPGNCAYNIPAAVRLTGKLNVAALQQSLDEIVRRHEALRTTFAMGSDRPIQVISPNLRVPLAIADMRELPESDREAEIQRLASEEARQPFELERGPLLRGKLLQLGETEHVLLFAIHHIVSDGWSMGVLIREVAALYEAFSSGKPSPLPELPIQYADFAVWQRQWLQDSVLEQQLDYWKQHLALAPRLNLPTDRDRPAVQTFRGAVQSFVLPPTLSQAVKTLSRKEGVTLFMTLLAAFLTLLHRYSDREDIVVGTDVANRNRSETEPLIGFFVNILPLRTDLSGNPSFRELLRRVREVALGAYAHQDLPFAKLVDALQIERNLSHNPLFQVLFVLQNAPMPPLELSGLTLTSLQVDTGTAKFDLALFMHETEQEIVGTWNYSTDLFDATTITRMSGQFETLLSSIVAQPDAGIKTMEIETETEKQNRLQEQKQRQEAKFKKFKTIKPKAVSLPQEESIKTDYLQPGQTLPLVVQSNRDDFDLADWAKSNREFIETKLLKHGAILFRGFNINSVAEFENVAQAICLELFGEYGDLPRQGVSGKVYGSTPYPADKAILFHNESSHLQSWPLKIWFFCVQPAQQGGETPIVDCRQLYQLIAPKLRERLEQKQLMYVRNYIEGLDVSWQDFFKTTDKAVVEEYCCKAGIDFEWLSDNNLRTRQIRQAIARHPRTGELVFFNQIQLHHISYLDQAVQESLLSLFGEEKLPRNVYYGDGSPIEPSALQEINEAYRQATISFPWQKGDILMLDNMLTAHGRNPYVGPRKIVVAMGEMIRG